MGLAETARARARFGSRPLVALAAVAVAVQLTSIVRVVLGPSAGPLPIEPDTAMLQHIGWYVTQGGVPYVDAWDVKPPLTHETTAVLAFLAGGNVYALHVLSVLATSAASTGIVVAIGKLTLEVTGDPRAGVTAGLVVLTHPGVHHLPAFGFRPKYLALFVGLVGVTLVLRRRPLAAGVALAMSPAYWQFGLVFPVLGLGVLAVERRRTHLGWMLGGVAGTTTVVLLPIVAWGAFPAMVSQTVLSGFVVSESGSALKHVGRATLFLGYTAPFAALGAYGLLRVAGRNLREQWWVLAGAAWFALQVAFLDFDSYPDLLGALVFVALGVGILLPKLTDRQRDAVVVAVVAATLVSTLFLGSFGVLMRPLGQSQNDDVLTRQAMITVGERLTDGSVTEPPADEGGTRADLGLPPITEMYWNRVVPDTCHYRLSNMEIQWIEATGGDYQRETCGGPPWL